MDPFDPSLLFRIVDLAGVLANGLIGGAVARRLKLDPVGFLVLAVVSGLGGGMLRDTLLQSGFPIALTDPWYLVVAMIGALIAYVAELRSKWSNRVLIILDFAAIGCWAATGTTKALSVGLQWLPALLLGVITAVGGGMIRDIATGRIPEVFGKTLYATTALVCSLEMLLFFRLQAPNVGMAVCIVTAMSLLIAARRLGWSLPGPSNIAAVQIPRPWRRSATSPDEP